MAKPSFLDIFHLESRYPVFDRICSYLSIDSIIALTRTGRALSGLYQSLIPLQWNVDCHLSRFVRDPQLFRSQMAIRNALVSGSVAVQFFERVLWKESDLDIFIEEGRDAKAFGKYLTEKEGYNFSGTSSGAYMAIDIEEVHTYTKRAEGDSAERKAQIILTQKIPLQAILRGFYSTVVVNFFAWNKAYSMFPLHTFVHHKGYMLKPLNNHFSTLLEKYSRRGWKFQNAMWPEEISPNQPIEGTRRIGDEFSWMIPFDVSNVRWSKTPDSVLEYASFDVHLEDRDEGTEKKHYTVTASNFFSDVLRHEYLYGVSGHWLNFLGERVDELTRLELYKMAPEARPIRPATLQGPNAPMYGCMEGHKKPDGWTYWDDEIPKWYQACRQLEEQSKKSGQSAIQEPFLLVAC